MTQGNKERPTRAGSAEVRFAAVAELRQDEDGNRWARGFIPYGVETIIGGVFREVIEPGFFAPALAEGQRVLARYNHTELLGSTSARPPSLILRDTPDGLEYEAELMGTTPAGATVAAHLERGNITQSSFAFLTRGPESDDEEWVDASGDDELPLRKLKRADRLVDVAPVDAGAYGDAATVGLRGAYEVRSAGEVLDEWQSLRARARADDAASDAARDRKSTRLNSSHYS